MMEREMITMIVDTLLVLYYEKMVCYMPSSFANLVFVCERIEVGLRRGKFDYPALMSRKPGENGENKKEGKPKLWLPFLHGQISDQPNNVITQPITVSSPNHPQNPSSNQPQGMLAYRTPNAQTPPLHLTNAIT